MAIACWCIITLAAWSWTTVASAQPHVQFDLTPIWAVNAALADAKTLPPDAATRMRYVWLRGGSAQELAVLSFVLNSVQSHLNTPVIPAASPAAVPLAGGKLIRLDLGELCTDDVETANLVNTWNKLSDFDDAFAFNVVTKEIVVADPPIKRGKKVFHKKFETTRVHGFASHVLQPMTELSQRLGNTTVPIIDARALMATSLTTLEGGLYYKFRGLTVGRTTLKGYLASRGASEQQVEQLESLEKAVIFFSQVTAKERMVSVFRGAGVRASRGGGIVSITFDPFDADRAAEDSPARNLLNFRGRGHEVILELPNGFHEWTLFDGQTGLLVAAAPLGEKSLVGDHEVPSPHAPNLQPGISCIRCHARDQGWRGITNDAPLLLAGGTDIFGDLTSPDDQRRQAQLLAGLYSGDWFAVGTGPLSVGRLTYNRVCVEATGLGAREVAELTAQLYNSYAYERMDVWDVALELGIVGLPPSDNDPETTLDRQAAVEALREFIAARPVPGQITREDANIGAIKAGVEIGRRGWQSSAHIAMERCYQRGLKP